MQLGPFRDGAEPELPEPETDKGGLAARWMKRPAAVRIPVSALAFLVAVTAGAVWLGETPRFGGEAFGFGASLLWNAWILAAFVAMFRVVARMEQQQTGPVVGWGIGLSLLVALGLASERLVALLV